MMLHTSERDRRDGLAAWVNEGLTLGEAVVYTEPEGEPEDRCLLPVLAARGIDVGAAREAGRLVGHPPAEVYRPDGVARIVRRLLAQGFPAVRLTAERATALTVLNEEGHLAVETTVDDLCREYPLFVLCQYQRSALTGSRLDEVTALHLLGIRDRQLGTRPHPGGLGLSGEIDLANEDVLAWVLRTATATCSTTFTLDLSQVGFLGVGGVRVMEETTSAFRDRGGLLRAVAPQPAVAQVFRLLGFDRLPGVAVVGRPG